MADDPVLVNKCFGCKLYIGMFWEALNTKLTSDFSKFNMAVKGKCKNWILEYNYTSSAISKNCKIKNSHKGHQMV